ncbi:MAG: hypothetical protein V2I79_05835 [Xanthomonadales bacterium]|jgi:hypothetical protein|nr:hypothetical protein [Xanthomonadales bacterium]
MKRLVLVSAMLAAGIGFSSTAMAEDITCDDIVWGAEILADNPAIGDACLDVVEKRGVMAAKFTARIVRQSVNSTIVQWQLPDGSWSASQRRYPERDAFAEIGDQEVRIGDLADRQVLNVYLPQDGHWTMPVAAAAAMAAAPEPAPEPEPVAAPEPEPAPVALPATATQVPAFALLGGLMLLLGGAVGFLRSRL